MEWHQASLSDFERIVALFGDYQVDKELSRCEAALTDLFAVLNSAVAAETAPPPPTAPPRRLLCSSGGGGSSSSGGVPEGTVNVNDGLHSVLARATGGRAVTAAGGGPSRRVFHGSFARQYSSSPLRNASSVR